MWANELDGAGQPLSPQVPPTVTARLGNSGARLEPYACASRGARWSAGHFVRHTCLMVTWESPEGLCAVLLCYVMSGATAAVLAAREETCRQFQRLLEPPSSLSARALPALGSASSADSGIQRDSWREPDQRCTWLHPTVPWQLRPVAPKVLLFLLLVGEWHQILLSSARSLRFLSPYCSQIQKPPVLLRHFQTLFSTSPFSLTWANSSFDLLPKTIMKQSIASISVFLHANLPEFP